jgi:hypothetical protein
MQILPIDLKKNADVADLIADMQPGDRIYFCATIKDKDDQTLNARIEEVTKTPDELPKPDEYDEEDDEKGLGEKAGSADAAEAEGAGRDQTALGGVANPDSAGQAGPMGS